MIHDETVTIELSPINAILILIRKKAAKIVDLNESHLQQSYKDKAGELEGDRK